MRIKPVFVLAALFTLGCLLSLSVEARAKSETRTGWISDSICGAKGMSAQHKACAIKCVTQKGAKWVFVDAKTKTVYAIKNQDSVNEDQDLGKEVKVTAEPEGKDTLQVKSIAPAA